jgi:hypothetical protein
LLEGDQRQPGLRVDTLSKVCRRVLDDQLERRPYGRVEQVAAADRRIATAHNDVGVYHRLVVLQRDIADERQELDLLADLVALVALALSVEVTERDRLERADAAQARRTDGVGFQELE